ncbi:hypothetical protein GQX74_007121, partial [Glossina fuscipes]
SSLWFVILNFIFNSKQCIYCYATSSPGETKPTRIEIEINGSANISCQLNLATFGGKKNSTSLYFVEEDTGQAVPSDNIDILNDTTIVFMLRNAIEQDRNYICKSDTMGIGVTHVAVGTSPLDVTDFKCRGYDYTYLVCNFTIPRNVLLTQYNLSYTAQSPNYLQMCQLEIQENEGICNLTVDRNNYRPNYEFYNFTLIGHNEVGTNVQSFWINHYESVIPPRPEYVFEKITNSSVVLKWHMPKYSYYTSKGLQYDIRLRPRDFDWMNHSNYEIRSNRSEYKLILRNLPYAYYWYQICVRIRVKRMARNDESTWSEPSEQEFQTTACPPELPPKTDIGSFYIDSSETRVRLYWQQLPEYKENGPDFQYVIKQVKRDSVIVPLKPIHIDRSSAIFTWHKRHRYEFAIKSNNSQGESEDSSSIIVPAWGKHHERMNPQWIRNIYHAANRSYTLSWSPPTNQSNLIDYTVFWCQSKQAVPNECRDTIQFQHVGKENTRFATLPQEQEQTLNLAVSANYLEYNSGMHWTMCTADIASDLVKLEPEFSVTSPRSISVQWSSDRVCSSLLEGYNLTYCRIHRTTTNIISNGFESLPCMEDTTTVTIPSTAKKFVVNNLKPFSSYKIEMYMFSKLKKGKVSETQVINTTEEAPSAPRNLKAFNITSNSAVITWTAPAHHNGKIRKYVIQYNNEYHALDCFKELKVCSHKDLTYKLENLSSYTSYKVYVTAYTNAASIPSNDIQLKTLIGIPSNPRHMMSKEKNQTVLQWYKPEVPSGRVEYYEVAVIVWYKEQIQRQHVSGVVGSTECVFHIPICIDADYRHTVQVRAVNIAERSSEIDYLIFAVNSTDEDLDLLSSYTENNDLKCIGTSFSEEAQLQLIERYRNGKKYVQYKSVWEKGPTYNCSSTKLSRITMLALLVVVSSLGVMAAFYVARNKYNKMANISCALPPGLVAITYPSKHSGDGGDFRPSKESFSNNESRHLLSSISRDSTYMCNNEQLGEVDEIVASSLSKSSGYVGSNHSQDYDGQDTCTTTVDNTTESCIFESPSVVDDAYMVMELMKTNENKSSSQSQAYVNPITSVDGYVQPNFAAITPIATASSSGYIKQLPQIMHPENGYIKPNNVFNWQINSQKSHDISSISPRHNDNDFFSTNNINGYVASQLVQKPTVQSTIDGYTSLDTLTKSTHSAVPQQTIGVDIAASAGRSALCNLPPISGYVTQKELSAFGQQQKIN